MSERPVALVTGAARGIGAATARALSTAGWAVVLTDICADIDGVPYALSTRADLDAVVAACGDDAIGVMADVRDSEQLDAAVSVATERFGGLDAVVAAAGVITGGVPSWEVDPATVAAGIDVNLMGVWRTVRTAMPALLQSPHGRVVAVASAAGLRGHAGIADYAAAKHGVVGLVRSLAVELGPHGVTVNAVAPGSTRTDVLTASGAIYGLADPDEFAVHHPIGRVLDPDEVAAAIAWLCAPERGGVTGVVLPVDGGMTA